MSKVKNPPYKAFILAAGFGTRLKPITNLLPKPMVEVNGRSLLWRTLDNLCVYGTREVVVNAHYLPDLIEAHMGEYMRLRTDMRIIVSKEEGILDTGGGVRHALAHFDEDEPFFVIAGDNLWADAGESSALERLAQGWNASDMDIFTLMQPVSEMTVTKGVGDYDLLDIGKVRRSLDKSGTHMWTNIRLNHPRIFQDTDRESFSFLEFMDEAERMGRFYALEHEGAWHHISTPEDLRAVNAHIAAFEKDEG